MIQNFEENLYQPSYSSLFNPEISQNDSHLFFNGNQTYLRQTYSENAKCQSYCNNSQSVKQQIDPNDHSASTLNLQITTNRSPIYIQSEQSNIHLTQNDDYSISIRAENYSFLSQINNDNTSTNYQNQNEYCPTTAMQIEQQQLYLENSNNPIDESIFYVNYNNQQYQNDQLYFQNSQHIQNFLVDQNQDGNYQNSQLVTEYQQLSENKEVNVSYSTSIIQTQQQIEEFNAQFSAVSTNSIANNQCEEGEDPQQGEVGEDNEEKSRRNACKQCNKYYKRLCGLQNHVKNHHKSNNVQDFAMEPAQKRGRPKKQIN